MAQIVFVAGVVLQSHSEKGHHAPYIFFRPVGNALHQAVGDALAQRRDNPPVSCYALPIEIGQTYSVWHEIGKIEIHDGLVEPECIVDNGFIAHEIVVDDARVELCHAIE